jgi:hypothetical protein
MNRLHVFGTALGLTLLFASAPAFAEGPPPKGASAAADGDQHYVFPDDPLDAGYFGPNDVHIRVLRHPMRTTLIRPRTQFVGEMLESIETM